MSLYGAVGPVDVGEVKVASHPEYRVFVSGCEVFDGIAHVVYIYCRSLFGGRYIAAIMMCLLLLRCILVAVISNCVGVAIGSWMMSDLMASSTPPPTYPSCLSFRRSE